MKWMKAVTLLTNGLAIVALLGWVIQLQAQDAAMKRVPAGHDVNRSRAMESNADETYMHLTSEDRRAFVDKVQKLKLGDLRLDVELALGKPWSDDKVTTKENRKFIGRFVKYYVTKKNKTSVNEHLDEWILLKFGANDQLEEIYSRVAEIPNRP